MVESLHILILEDNPADAELTQFELQEGGIIFSANVATNEKDYVQAIQDYCPDLILSDYDLPNYNGALALAEARRRCPDTPFILVTGAVTEDRAIDILTQGAKDYVLKTRLQQRLAPAVKRALAEAEEHRARKQAETELREAHKTLAKQVQDRTSQLQESRERLSLALTSSGMGTFEWDLVNNKRFFDDYVYFLLGIKPENFTGKAEEFFQAMHPDDRSTVQDAQKKAIEQGGPYETEYRAIWPDGSIHHIAARGKVLRDTAGHPVRMIGVCWEITERKQAEQALLENRTLLQEVMDGTSDPVYVKDSESRMIMANDALAKVVGKPLEGIIGRTDSEYYGDAVVGQTLRENDLKIMASGKSETIEETVPTPRGSRVLLSNKAPYRNASGNIVGIIGISRDITDRKRTEEALKESEERYRALFDSMTEGFAIHEIITNEQGTPVDYRFLDINPAFERLTGLKRKDVVGKTLKEVLPGDDPKWLRMYGAVALTGEPVQFENYSPALRRHYDVLAYRHAPRQFAVIFMDITERKRVEEKMRRYELLAAHARDVILFIRRDDGRVMEANAAAVNAYGYTREELLGLTIHDLRAPETQELTPGQMDQAERQGILFETSHRRKDGTIFPVEVSSQGALIDGMQTLISVIREITERKRTEAEIARLASFPMLNPAPIIEVDLAGEIHFCNPAAERLFPDLRQQGLEHPLLADWETIVRSACEGGLKDCARELNIYGHWYQETLHFVEDTKRILIYGRDITLRKEAEEELREHAAQLEDANKDLESFGFSIAHDLRAPLRAIAGYSQMILKKEGERFDEETRRRFQMITDNAETMGHLIDDLLAFSRLGSQAVAKRSLDMEELIQEVWQELLAINPCREMTLKITPMPTACGDRMLIRQVYGNLLGNAVKFTQGREAAVVEAGSCVQDSETIYYVRDNGIGFDMRFYDKLFGVFQRLHSDEVYKGTGIGLALVKRVINRHGGRVWAEGEVDKGATFYFTLPTRQE